MKNVCSCFVLWCVRCLVSVFVFPRHFLTPCFSTWIMSTICLKGKEIHARKGFPMPFCVPTTLSALSRKEYIQEVFCLGYLSTLRCCTLEWLSQAIWQRQCMESLTSLCAGTNQIPWDFK